MLDVTSSFVFDVTALSPLGAAVTWSAADVTVSLDGTAEAATEDDVTVSLDETAEAAAEDDVTFVSPDSLLSGGADIEAVCVVFPDDVIEDSNVIVTFSRLQLLFNYEAKHNRRYTVGVGTLKSESLLEPRDTRRVTYDVNCVSYDILPPVVFASL